MKKSLVFLIVLSISLSSFAQMSNVYKQLNNKNLETRLKRFAKSGIEKSIDVKKVSTDDLIKHAKAYLGTPHAMGGLTKKGIDCSGLLFVSFKECGLSIARTSDEQARFDQLHWFFGDCHYNQ